MATEVITTGEGIHLVRLARTSVQARAEQDQT